MIKEILFYDSKKQKEENMTLANKAKKEIKIQNFYTYTHRNCSTHSSNLKILKTKIIPENTCKSDKTKKKGKL